MGADSNLASSFLNLKMEDPWLPSKPWESISSESGVSQSESSNSNSSPEPIYDPSMVSEVNLVRLAINALQGVEATLIGIEKLSESFCTDPADRTSHRIPNLWHRSSSTDSLGKILKSIGHSGFVAFLLRKFVDYFLCRNSIMDGISREEDIKRKKANSDFAESQINIGNAIGTCCAYSLVNQAFAVAVEKVLAGYICAIDTLYASVQLRRSPKKHAGSACISSGVGCLTSVVHSEITLVEVYLHTKELRTHIEALGNICFLKNVSLAYSTSSLGELTAEATTDFSNFPRGAYLLTYLYSQFRDADPVHRTLLKFLFIRSYEPYCGFIKSWIFQAKVDDPYKEFIVEYMDDSSPHSHGMTGFCSGIGLSSIKERDWVPVPCFLKDFCRPIIRAGQQLRVLIKLLELCQFVCSGDETFEDILPCWSGSSSDHLTKLPPLTFSKRNIAEMVLRRESMYRVMQEKLQILFTRLDIKYQQINCSVTPFGHVPVLVDCLFSSSTGDKGDSNFEAFDSDASSAMDEISYLVDPLESSECSSLYSSGEQDELERPTEQCGNSIEAELRCSSASELFTNLFNENIFSKPSQIEKSNALGCASHRTIQKMDPNSQFVHPYYKEMKLSHTSEHFQSGGGTCSRFPETRYGDYQYFIFWPLGGLLENPFNVDEGCRGEAQLSLSESSIKVPDRKKEIWNGGISCIREVFASDDSSPKQAQRVIQHENATHGPSWNLKYNYNHFNTNPMLTKNTAFHMMDKSKGRTCMSYKQCSLSYFDFSSVENPHEVYGERFLHGFQGELPMFMDSDFSAVGGADEYYREQGDDGNDIPVDQRNCSAACSSSTFSENLHEENFLASAYGGAKWENSLSYLGKSVILSSGGDRQSLGATFDIPLDVIIDKCILQEILLQYKYVSNFTIKLLEEGFELRQHLLSLRRYHFMEFADWADLFILSLWRHKWCIVEPNQRISEIQGLLDLAVQRSSCEGDPYKERLFVHMKGHGTVPLSASSTGIHAFDFISLGYRVDWPVSIVLTPGALKIYADIFSFLIQIKLAVFSLTDLWCSLKDLVHLISLNCKSGLDERDKNYFNILMKMRYQINHFVSTLQQYVQSQLSHVSWCRFLHSLKHQVRDMLDLESVHMSYLADSLQICFLSEETRPVAVIIENILQCALDFRSCFTRGGWEVGLDRRETSGLLTRLNFSQVLTVKATFEKNLKELYLCYLKSPKHEEFGLCHFWGYLNYNSYYSECHW